MDTAAAVNDSELWLVRHARPVVKAGVCYGRLDVSAEPEHTHTSAQALAQALSAAHRTAPKPLRLCTSPALRAQQLARQTAALLAGTFPALPIQTDPRLAEMDFGHWEGQHWDDIPRAALDAWTDDFHHHRPGDGESVAAVLQRVRTALCDATLHEHTAPPQRVVWFTHAGVMRAVDVLLTQRGQPLQAADWPNTPCAHGAWRVLVWSGDGPARWQQA